MEHETGAVSGHSPETLEQYILERLRKSEDRREYLEYETERLRDKVEEMERVVADVTNESDPTPRQDAVPCPFCKHAPILITTARSHRPAVECSNYACHASPRVEGTFAEAAIRNWNRVMREDSTSQFEKLTAFEKTEVSYSSGVGGKGDE